MNRKSLLLAAVFVPILAATAFTQTKVSAAGTYKLTVIQTLATANGARTMTLAPKTHRIFLAAADYAAPAAAAGAPAGRAPRPEMGPNSFKVLVFGMDTK